MRALAIVVVLLGCGDPEPAPVTTAIAPLGESTIAARDYIGPKACGDCHPNEYARWSNSLHRRMNQLASADAVIGDFATRVTYAGGEARFTHDATGYAMTLAKAGHTTRYRITRTIGVRGLQEYVGIADGRTEEVRLPFAWWPRRAGWFPQPYFDPWLDEATFDPYAEVTDPWATRCPWCHSTYPFAQRIARATTRPVGHGLEQFYAMAGGSDRLRVAEQITPGISCESCHLGGRAHAAGGAIHLVPGGAIELAGAPRPSKFTTEARDATIVNQTCAQCHSGPSPQLPDHSALRNSAEALDLAASSCRGIRCIDCHDPHRADARADTARSLAACIGCHTAFADPRAAALHGGHPDRATPPNCLDCHMPRYVLGIDGFVRTHRINRPSDRKLLAAGAPNACNLCHLDRPIEWTLAELERGWSARSSGIDRAAYHGASSVGDAWLASESPAIRLIAIGAYGRSHDGANLLRLLVHLFDRAAYVRSWTTFAIDDLLR